MNEPTNQQIKQSTKPKISVIILNWNRKDDSIDCIRSLKKQDYQNLDIVFVDNGSADNSVQKISKRFPDIKIIANTENFGYAKGNNIGIKYALKNKADYVFVLNNDTVVDKRCLTELLGSMQKSDDSAAVSPIIYYYKSRRIWSAGGKFNKIIGLTKLNHKIPKKSVVNFLTGCALLIDAKKLSKIGLFDEKFFLYYEDVDWCQKAIELGYKLKLAKKAKIWHKESLASGGIYSKTYLYYMSRNYFLNARKHLNWYNWIIACPIILLYFSYLFTKAKLNHENPLIVFKGVSDSFSNKFGIKK